MRTFAIHSVFLLLSVSPMLQAHPIPDIPVRGSFEADGTYTIKAEVDPRCFEADPEADTYLTLIQKDKLWTPEEREGLKAKARDFVERGVEFFFEPQGPFKPEFTWEFTTLGGGPLVNYDDPVMVTGTWQSKVPDGLQGYHIRAKDPRNLSIVFENTLHGKRVERTAVLFPGETSFSLKMDGSNASATAAPHEITAESPSVPSEKAGSGITWLRAAALLVAVLAALWLTRLGRT